MDVEPKNRFERQREKMKKKILSSAISVFSKKGFNNTRIKDITDNVKTSVGIFYHYFNSKEQVFDIIITKINETLFDKLRYLSELNKIPRIRSLRNLFKEYLDIFRNKENAQSALLFIEQMGGINPKFREKKRELIKSFEDEMEKVILRLIEMGFIRDQNASFTAHIWQLVILEGFVWWINSEKEISEKELIDNVLNFLVKGTVTK